MPTRLKINGIARTLESIGHSFIVDRANTFLITASSKFIATTARLLETHGIFFRPTDCLDYIESGSIVSRFYPASPYMFHFLKVFEMRSWLMIALINVILSFIAMVISIKIGNFLEYTWNLYLLLFSRSIQAKVKKVKHILGVWLMSSLFISILFTTHLMDYMITAVPIIKIDTFEQLSLRDDLTIFARTDSSFSSWANNHNSDVAKRIKTKIKSINLLMEMRGEIASGLRNGSSALVYNRLNMVFLLTELMQVERLKQNEERLIDLMHVSEEGGGYDPYFLLVTKDSFNFNLIVFDTRFAGLIYVPPEKIL